MKINIHKHAKPYTTLCMFMTLTGCVVQQPARPNDPYYAPALVTNDATITPVNGSLYSPNNHMNLFGDIKALRVGDIVTVILNEQTSSSKSAASGVTKESEITSNAGTLLNTIPSFKGLGLGNDITQEREFTGESEADQSNQLNGSISVTVVGQYPNGNLSIRGEKWMTLNRGDEYIRISGIVRPADIDPDNTIMSTKIANARITYSGEGELANAQKMGWLSRFFINPIWPF